MLKIVSFRICPFVQRVTARLEAGNIPYKVEYISLSDKPAWFLELSPTGQVPLLITKSGKALFESDAIVEYVDEVTDPLVEGLSPEQKALERAWCTQGAKHYLVQCSTMQSRDGETLADRREKLDRAFDKAERQLGKGPYFGGAEIGNVDIAWLPLLHRAHLVEDLSGYDFLSDHPKVKAWQGALMATGIAQKSVPEDFDKAFSDFYLSDQTFLGRGATDPEDEAAAKASPCCGEGAGAGACC